ncbi:ultraviolet-B receptor UVR8-like isoform X1 [Populus nigra]|uniref:ultraviolet-B receptor UVR8-like isoform X1 n=1 Tax=Populus nigra TaxID=3691 RepID=UPI002B2726BD|nr:ultraviolet-B receptor UVR8-like isoform X1 [Populus nigra]
MNGERKEEGVVNMDVHNEKLVYMWGYLPGALPQRSPILSPLVVRSTVDAWKDVCGGGCGFAMAISESGKLITWGSTDDLGQSYVTSGKHGETPEAFPLPTEASIVKAAAGWAHCVAATDNGEVYTWGWKECIPSGKVFSDPSGAGGMEKDVFERQNLFFTEQGSPRSQGPRSSGGSGTLSGLDGRGSKDESTKRRRISSAKQAAESSSTGDETPSAFPCLVTLNPGVRIVTVSAGGRHTLTLSVSDIGQVWGWGYGGEGQLGLGSRIRMVSSPHPIPCIDSSYGKERDAVLSRGGMTSEGQGFRVPGTYVKGIACGGRHSAVITDAGALLTFGWGLYGQCGQGSTDDELSPTCVSSLLGIRIEGVAAGLWHTVCVSADGDVYTFGGNQFGQLGTGGDQAEILPRLLEAPSLENIHAKTISCGARHSTIISEDGKVFCWGWNKYGQLGLGDVIDRNVPSQVTIDGCVPKNVACGWWHTLLLAESPA